MFASVSSPRFTGDPSAGLFSSFPERALGLELLTFQVYQVQIQENLERRDFSDTEELSAVKQNTRILK